jgi:hypothetical protein
MGNYRAVFVTLSPSNVAPPCSCCAFASLNYLLVQEFAFGFELARGNDVEIRFRPVTKARDRICHAQSSHSSRVRIGIDHLGEATKERGRCHKIEAQDPAERDPSPKAAKPHHTMNAFRNTLLKRSALESARRFASGAALPKPPIPVRADKANPKVVLDRR